MKYNLILLLILFYSCSSPNKKQGNSSHFEWQQGLTTEQNIAKNIVFFSTNNEFPFLDGIVEDKRVILLGERTHIDLTTIEAKINMTAWLAKKGVKTLALEGVSFLPTYVLFHPEYKEVTKTWELKNFWHMPVSGHKVMDSFLEMVRDENIKVWGVDIEASYKDIESLQLLLDKYTECIPLKMDWNRFSSLYERKFIHFRFSGNTPPSEEEQYELMEMINIISNYVEEIIHKHGECIDLKVIKQWIRNVNTNFSFVEEYDPVSIKKTTFIFRNRDFQMAENVMFITDNSPREKLSVWCANFHAAKDISQTMQSSDSLLYFRFQSMGETLYNHYGDKIYSIGFSAFSDQEENTLEFEIEKLGVYNKFYGFIDFGKIRFEDGYKNKKFRTSLFTTEGNWLAIFDGYYYISHQEIIKF